MAFISGHTPLPADDPEKDPFAPYRDSSGNVDHILGIHALNPPSLQAHMQLYRTVMFGPSPLSRVQREMLALVTAAAIGCHY